MEGDGEGPRGIPIDPSMLGGIPGLPTGPDGGMNFNADGAMCGSDGLPGFRPEDLGMDPATLGQNPGEIVNEDGTKMSGLRLFDPAQLGIDPANLPMHPSWGPDPREMECESWCPCSDCDKFEIKKETPPAPQKVDKCHLDCCPYYDEAVGGSASSSAPINVPQEIILPPHERFQSVRDWRVFIALKQKHFIPEIAIYSAEKELLADSDSVPQGAEYEIKKCDVDHILFWIDAIKCHAMARDLEGVERAISIISKRQQFDPYALAGVSLLHYLDQENTSEDVVELFVKCKADVNIMDPAHSGGRTSKTPLARACEKGYTNILKMMYNFGAEVNVADKEGQTPLFFAARKGHLETAKQLIQMGAKIDFVDCDGWSPLHMASSKGYLEIVKLLVEKGANIDLTVDDGWSAFHVACSSGHIDVMKYLVSQNANINSKDDEGWCGLDLAASKGHMHVMKYLLDDLQADVDHRDEKGCTALHMAVIRGEDQKEVIELLLEYDANSNIQTKKDGTTVLHICATRGYIDLAVLLVSKGANLMGQNYKGQSPLHTAANYGHFDFVDMYVDFFEKGLPVTWNLPDKQGRTALHLAAGRGFRSIVELLVAVGTEPMLVDENGLNAIHMAIAGEQAQCIEALTGMTLEQAKELIKESFIEESTEDTDHAKTPIPA